MAKKKKAAKKSTKKTTKKSSGKPKAAKASPKPGPFNVSTGRGPSPLEIGTDLVAMFNQGLLKEIEDKYWSPQIESVEGFGVHMGWRGRQAVEGKNNWWMEDHVMHGGSAEGPYVGSTGFAVRFRLDVETKSTGKREWMEEVGVYTIKDGKIIREEFMYSVPSQPTT